MLETESYFKCQIVKNAFYFQACNGQSNEEFLCVPTLKISRPEVENMNILDEVQALFELILCLKETILFETFQEPLVWIFFCKFVTLRQESIIRKMTLYFSFLFTPHVKIFLHNSKSKRPQWKAVNKCKICLHPTEYIVFGKLHSTITATYSSGWELCRTLCVHFILYQDHNCILQLA